MPVQAKAKPKLAKEPLAPSNVQALHAGKAIEEIYQKKSQLEHILLRPDTYIGSTEKQQQQLWVHDGTKMALQNITYVPGLYKIFDEILVGGRVQAVPAAARALLPMLCCAVPCWVAALCRQVPTSSHACMKGADLFPRCMRAR